MISISQPIKDSRQCQYYQEMTQSDYYANRYEQAGYWAGSGAEKLGLSGRVQPEVLQRLFDGYSPDGSTQLVQNAGSPDRQRALDYVPSPDKSVSVAWAMLDRKERGAIERLQDEAVQAVVDFLEENAALTRRGKGGAVVEPAGLVIACVPHFTSRKLDMQLHTHLLILNLAVRADGTTGALHNPRFFELRKQADMVYQTHLALGLRLELGLELEAEGQSFRVRGVPKKVCEAFSQRRKEIVEYQQARGLTGPLAGDIAALATRTRKRHVPREELFQLWHKIGDSLGWGPQQARELTRDRKVLKLMSRVPGHDPLRPYHGPYAESQKQADSRPPHQPPAEKGNPTGAVAAGPPGRSAAEETGRESASPAGDQREKRGQKTFRQVASNRYVFRHRRWGEVLWRKNLGLVELRVQMKRLQPKAPGWNKAAKLALPSLRIIPWKLKLFDAPAPHRSPRPKVVWKKGFLFAELRVQRQPLFPGTPAWSPARKLTLPRLSLGLKSPTPPKPGASDKQKQEDSQGMGHSR